MLLAGLGVYGVMTQGVQQRTREIGVRLALGAARGDILRLVIGRALVIAVAGIAVGIALALPSMKLLTALLYQVKPGDPVVLGALALLLLGVALVAGYLPARRATRLDPLQRYARSRLNYHETQSTQRAFLPVSSVSLW